MSARRRIAGWLVALAALVALLAWRPHWALEAEYARLRWLAGASEHTLDAAGHRWAYLEAGPAGAPVIVLVHGLSGNKESWLPLMRRLSDVFRVIAIDLAGWNESSREPGADYGIAAQAERLAAFIETLDAPLALLAGHSMGGHIAGVLAAERPDLVPRLALLSSAGVRFRDNDFSRALAAGEYPYLVTNRASLRRFLELVFTDPPFLPWPADLALVRQRRANLDFERAVLKRITTEPEVHLLQSRLRELSMPVGLIWCRDDRVIDVTAGLFLSAALPQSRLVLLEGCGHMPQWSEPVATAAALARFAQARPQPTGVSATPGATPSRPRPRPGA